jgi:aryl-alcohol dehydrogenase-like predicted oxidoreductase
VDHQVRRSLHNLGVEAIDVMQYHGLPEDDEVFGETLEALRAHVEAGRIRFLGASCNGDHIPRLLAAGDFSTVQLAYNVFDQAERHKGLPLAEEHDLGVLVRIPLALGVLADKVERLDQERRRRFEPFLDELRGRLPEGMSVPEAALRFVSGTPGVTAPLTGTRRPAHVREAARAGDGRGLPEELYNWLRQLYEQGEMPQWSWNEHYKRDWPTGAQEANLELCRSVDI